MPNANNIINAFEVNKEQEQICQKKILGRGVHETLKTLQNKSNFYKWQWLYLRDRNIFQVTYFFFFQHP